MGKPKDVNVWVATGRVAKISDLRETKNGVFVCDVTVAVKTYYSGNSSTVFMKCTFWKNLAEVVYDTLEISDTIYVTGSIVDDNIELPGSEGRRTSGRTKLDQCSFRLVQEGPRRKELDDEEEEFSEEQCST